MKGTECAYDVLNVSCAIEDPEMTNSSGRSLCSGRPLRRMLCAGEEIEKAWKVRT